MVNTKSLGDPGSTSQVGFADDVEAPATKDRAGLLDVIDVEGDGGPAVRVDDRGIGIIDVDLALKHRHADVDQGVGSRGKFHDEKFVLGEREFVEAEDFSPLLRVAEDQTKDRAIGRVGDHEADNLDLRPLKGPEDFEKLSDPVFEEYGILRDRRPVSPLQGFVIDFAAAGFAKAHGVPRLCRVRESLPSLTP